MLEKQNCLNRLPSIAVTVVVVKTGHGRDNPNGVIIIVVQSELVSLISINQKKFQERLRRVNHYLCI